MWSQTFLSSLEMGTHKPGKKGLLHSRFSSFSITALGYLIEIQMVLVQVRAGSLSDKYCLNEDQRWTNEWVILVFA